MPVPVTVKTRRLTGSPRLFFGYYFLDITLVLVLLIGQMIHHQLLRNYTTTRLDYQIIKQC